MTCINLLLAIPIITYLISYFYLAYYHRSLLLFNVIVHENGKYSFLQSLFYASHFLGHIPVLTVLAFLFTGYYLVLTGKIRNPYNLQTNKMLIWLLIVFLIISFFSSLTFFGMSETVDFIVGRTQGRGVNGEGGAWDLHLPSLLLLVFFLPVYLYLILRFLKVDIVPSLFGLTYLIAGFLLLIVFNYLFNKFDPVILKRICTDPRYLAHAVRELATFPLTYFPIPLYFILLREKSVSGFGAEKKHRILQLFLVAFSLIFLAGFIYEVWAAILGGIGNLSQKPAFAHGGKLGIPYLLASHYFEHFLDSIYFTLLTLVLFSWHKVHFR